MKSHNLYRQCSGARIFSRRSDIIRMLVGLLITLSASSWAVAILLDITITDINPDQSDSPSFGKGTGGRVNGLASVAGNNQIFYAASEWGGLFKTTNGGRAWFRLDRHLPTATWDVEVDPLAPDQVYATSFYDGRTNSLAGINVSRDGGNTWVHPGIATLPPNCPRIYSDELFAYGISIDPRNPNNVYIGQSCGLAISNDRGETWRVVDPVAMNNAFTTVNDVMVHYGEDGGQIIDVCGSQGHFRSTNGGNTWSRGTGLPSGLCSLAISPDESYVLFATVGTRIFESNDGGATWPIEFQNRAAQGRIPFVATNQRSDMGGDRFDLWFGDVNLFRASCTTPSVKEPGGPPRCPNSSSWIPSLEGAHTDLGDIVFDTQATNDACPIIVSNDGGVYFNTRTTSPGCHSPLWQQPDVSPHGLWLWGMDGADRPGPENEDLYFAMQDNGFLGTRNAGSANPSWQHAACCDQFDVVADSIRVLTTEQNSIFEVWGAGLTSVSEINTPGSAISTFQQPDGVDRFGSGKYVIITTQGAFITEDITAQPIDWRRLGQAPQPPGLCSVQAAVPPSPSNIPTFYFQAGQCMIPPENPDGDQLWQFIGTDPSGIWQPISLPGGGGIGIFAVDPNNPNRLYASQLRANRPPRMIFSTDGGATWHNDANLDNLMSGDGKFKLKTEVGPTDFTTFAGYTQPSLVAFDPEDPNILVAGGRDSGVFVSTNSGNNWSLVTDPLDSGNSGIPHLPRPWHAYFDHEPPGVVSIYIGTQGRGVWRISIPAAAADLSITKTDSPDPVAVGNNLTYTVTVTNNGPDTATSVTVTDNLPAETTFVSCFSTGGGDCGGSANNQTVTFASLASGETETITFVATVNCSVADGTLISNTATVSSFTPDPNPNNNSATATTTASNPPPTITGATVDQPVLWPPNHRLVNVTVSYEVTDNCPLPPNSCTLSVTSNEPINGTGDGDTSPDWIIIDAHHVLLRAERAGNGNGRIYTITIRCMDGGGNSSSQNVEVHVPHDRGRR